MPPVPLGFVLVAPSTPGPPPVVVLAAVSPAAGSPVPELLPLPMPAADPGAKGAERPAPSDMAPLVGPPDPADPPAAVGGQGASRLPG